MVINERESSIDDGKDLMEARLRRISELIGMHKKTEAENVELQKLLVEQRQYEASVHREEFKSYPLTIEEKEELAGLRIRHHSDGLNDLEAKRMVELARRQEKNN